MAEDVYFAAHRSARDEGARLRNLAAFYDGPTQRWLPDAAPLPTGARCLEFGFGAGSMLAWFADQVGPDGDVLGIDADIRHAPAFEPPIRVQAGDIYTAPSQPGRFDLVYARLVLEHLPHPAGALARMVEWAKPGGAVAVLDLDCTCVRALDLSHPDAEQFNQAAEKLCDAIGAAGLLDPAFGLTLAEGMRAAGLIDVRETRMDREEQSGSPWALFQAATTRILGEALPAAQPYAIASATILERPGMRYQDQALVAVVGRVPAPASTDQPRSPSRPPPRR